LQHGANLSGEGLPHNPHKPDMDPSTHAWFAQLSRPSDYMIRRNKGRSTRSNDGKVTGVFNDRVGTAL